MKLSPAFQLYPGDWLSSASIALMTPAEEGAYIRLLCIAWREKDCGLPDDDDSLASLSRLGKRWHGMSGQRIRSKFITIEGRLFNERLLEERQKQLEWRTKSSEGGKKSAATKAQAKLKGGSRVVEECLQPNANSSFSSSSSITEEAPHTPQRGDLSLVEPPLKSSPHKSKKRTTDEIKKALGAERLPWWESFWKVYPCHEGMNPAMDTYERKIHEYDLAVKVYRGAERYAAQIAQKQIADPTTPMKYGQGWLKDERWTDEIERVAVAIRPKSRDMLSTVSGMIQDSLARGEEPW